MKGQNQNIGMGSLNLTYPNKEKRLPLIGEKFPSVKVPTTHGKLQLPDHFSGKWFVLFSHPGDFTPVCTTEFVAFAKKQDEFQKLNCELIGLSIDQVFSHIKWIEWIDLELETEIRFPVISDDTGKVSSMLGMLHPGKGTNTVRAVFVVDDQGIIRLMLYYPQEIGRNIDEVLRIVKALQISDEQNAATPADWPNNELIGDAVIIPPPTDEKTAIQRLSEHECYDWWFCHKRLNGSK